MLFPPSDISANTESPTTQPPSTPSRRVAHNYPNVVRDRFGRHSGATFDVLINSLRNQLGQRFLDALDSGD